MSMPSHKPRVFILNPDHVMVVKDLASKPDNPYAEDLRVLQVAADTILAADKVYTVTWSGHLPPSGDIHDYFSISPYWWPDPDKPDGLPYIRKDGVTNPERDKISDRRPCEKMITDVCTLSRAYYFLGEEKYAAYATRLLRAWFLDEDTKMNPNINYGQIRRGHNLGHKSGLIETRRFCLLVDAIGLLESSLSWTPDDQKALNAWMNDFLDWLIFHPLGCEERDSSNNHGTAYDMQVIALCLYTGRRELAKLVLEHHTKNRVCTQIEPDGSQPEELRRTKGWHYCVENIKYFFCIAQMATHLGLTIYDEPKEGNGGLKGAIQWLLPHTTWENNWPYMQITAWQPERFLGTLHVAFAVYKCDKMKETLERMGWQTPDLETFINIPD